jgi:hypothetical protein
MLILPNVVFGFLYFIKETSLITSIIPVYCIIRELFIRGLNSPDPPVGALPLEYTP